MITEKGTLKVGIEKDGKFHRDFEIRPALVRDTLDVANEHTEKELNNLTFYSLCIAAKQVVRIGDISPVTVEVLMDMFDEDFGELAAARERLARSFSSFHDDRDVEKTGDA